MVPDIMTVGKGFGAGFPITGVISRDEIVHAEPWSKPSFSSSSYGGNPLAAAAASASLAVLVEEKLIENAARVGDTMLRRLCQMKEQHPLIGDVRGRGLLIGVDLVADRKKRTPLDKARCERVFMRVLASGPADHGVLAQAPNQPAALHRRGHRRRGLRHPRSGSICGGGVSMKTDLGYWRGRVSRLAPL